MHLRKRDWSKLAGNAWGNRREPIAAGASSRAISSSLGC
jgi:hypothetical protein